MSLENQISTFLIHVDPDFEIKGNIKDFYDLYDEVKKRTGLNEESQICFKYLDYSVRSCFANLTDCGFDYSNKFTCEAGYKVFLFFQYNDIKFSLPFYSCQSIFDIKLELAKKFHTLQQHIIIKDYQSNQNVEALRSLDIVEIDVVDTFNIYKIFSIHDEIEEEYYCLVKGTNVNQLKSTIAVYQNISESGIIIFTENHNFDKANTSLDDEAIKGHTLFYDYSESKDAQPGVIIILTDSSNDSSFQRELNYFEGFHSYYSFCTFLEKSLFIDRYIFLAQSIDKDKEIINKTGIKEQITATINLNLFLYDDPKNQIDSLNVSTLLKVSELKKLIFKHSAKKLRLKSERNFGVVIAGQIIFKDDYISKYIPAFSSNQASKSENVYIIKQKKETETITFENENTGNKKNIIVPSEISLNEAKKILFPNEYPENIILSYDTKKKSSEKLNGSSKFSDIINYIIKDNQPTIIYNISRRSDDAKYSICYIKLTSSISNFSANSRVIDIFPKDNSKTKSSKKTSIYYYRAYPKSNNQYFLSFKDKLSQLHLPPQTLINVIKIKDNIEYSICYTSSSDRKSFLITFKGNDFIFKPNVTLIDSIPELKRRFKIPKEQELVLLSDFVRLNDDDIPIFCFPEYTKGNYILNIESNTKTLIFKQTSLFTIEKKFKKDDYEKISEIICNLFKVNLNDIEFFYDFPFQRRFKLPSIFSAEAFPDKAEIAIELPKHNQYVHNFYLDSDKVHKQLTIYDVFKEEFDQLKLKLQKEFKIFKYSPGFITLKFENNVVQSFKHFDYLNRDCVINISVDDNKNDSIKVSVVIINKTETYHFLRNDKIEILMKLISFEFNIEDYKKIKIENSNGEEMKDSDVIMENSKYSVIFPKINITCEGSLVKEKTEIKIDCIHSYEEIKKEIHSQLKLKDDNFSLFILRGKWYKELKKESFFESILKKENELILAHRFITDLHIDLIRSNEKKEVLIFTDLHMSELSSLSILRSILYLKYHFEKSELSYTSDGKNIVLNTETVTILDYLRKQKEKEPNTNGNHLYIIEMNDSKSDEAITFKCQTKQKEKEPNKKENHHHIAKKNDSKLDRKMKTLKFSSEETVSRTNTKADENNDGIEAQEISTSSNNEDDDDIKNQEIEQLNDVDRSDEVPYKFHDYVHNKTYTIQLSETATVDNAKSKLSKTIYRARNSSFIELIFGGKKLRDNIKLKSLHLTPEEQIESYMHDYDPKRLKTMIALSTRGNNNILPPVKDDL